MKYVIAYDLGTSSFKASIVDENLNVVKSTVVEYETYSSAFGINEQKPLDWIKAMKEATIKLINNFLEVNEITAIAISGHSLGVVMIDQNNELVTDITPIWNDSRAKEEAEEFFKIIDYKDWYLTTGNGFTKELYSVFKIMWYKKHKRDLYDRTYKFIGTKDYLNMILSGKVATDHSYASGSGVYNLEKRKYEMRFIDAAQIDYNKFPEIKESSDILGDILPNVAKELGISTKVKIVCGGVDNACMTLGAGCFKNNDAYVSLGSSSWIAVSDKKPIVNFEKKIYTWAHVVKGLYIPSSGIFSAGSAKDYMMKNFFGEVADNKYQIFDELAKNAPVGANGVFFNPVLAGGSYVDSSTNMKGGLMNFDLSTTKSDIARAILEGIAYDIKLSLNALESVTKLPENIKFVGGGTKSKVWMQIFSDIFGKNILKIKACRTAATIGAAAIALYGTNIIKDYTILERDNQIEDTYLPNTDNHLKYLELFKIFVAVCDKHAEIAKIIEKEE